MNSNVPLYTSKGKQMIAVTFNQSDKFVAKLQRKGVKVRWDGWNMVFFTPHKRAERNPRGRRNGSQWGFENVVSPNSKGIWLVDYALTRGVNG